MTNSMMNSHRGEVTLSRAQLRKIKKPLIERRRREKINDYMNELKMLTLSALNKDEEEYAKMEKADILEMAVHYIKTLRAARPLSTGVPVQSRPATSTSSRYTDGYRECAQEVHNYLQKASPQPSFTDRVMTHLSSHTGTSSLEATSLSSLPGSSCQVTSPVEDPAVAMRYSTPTKHHEAMDLSKMSALSVQIPRETGFSLGHCTLPALRMATDSSRGRSPPQANCSVQQHMVDMNNNNSHNVNNNNYAAVNDNHNMDTSGHSRSMWRPWSA